MDAEDRRQLHGRRAVDVADARGAAVAPVDPVEAAEARGARLLAASGVPVIIAGDGTVLVTVANAAKLTGQGVRTIYNWIEGGKITVRLTASGHKRVVVSSLFKDVAQETAAQEPNA